MKNCTLWTTLFALLTVAAWAQNPKLKRADKLMAGLDYQAAIALYQEILEKNDAPDVRAKVAQAYRKLRDYANAEVWYSQLANAAEPNPIHLLQYGQMLQLNNKCKEAEDWYKRYLRLRPYDARKKHLQRACAYEQELLTKSTSTYQLQSPTFNAADGDLGSAFYKNGLVFASVRRDTMAENSSNFLDLYFVEIQAQETGLTYGQPERFSEKLNSPYHEGIVAFNSDYTEIYVTRNRRNPQTTANQVFPLEIMRSQNANDSAWTALEPLPFNNDNYSVAHPSLTPDENRLFFSSDMPGGFGGKDLYVSEKTDGQWGRAVNLGPAINTEGDELYPFYENKRLYFASDGQVGLGGLDVFFVNDLSNGDWSEVENPGAPINSTSDDFGIIVIPGGQFGYFTSNRAGGAGGDDIYSFYKGRSRIFFDLTDATTGNLLQSPIIKSNCGEQIVIQWSDNQPFVQLDEGQCCELSFWQQGYYTQTQQICVRAGDQSRVKIALQPEAEIPTLRIEGTIYDQNTGLPLEGAVVRLTSDNCGGNSMSLTNAAGNYQFSIKKPCCYQLRIEKSDFFATTMEETICAETVKDVFEKSIYLQPFVANAKNEAIAELPKEITTFKQSAKDYKDGNSIAYLLNIYYDLGKTNVRKDAEVELEKLLKILKDNPDLIVEISAHTDSKGDSRQNLPLSQKRAESVVTWLVQRGVKRNQLQAVGYGETQLLNICDDGVPCTEDQHQLNRRTEFKVLGKIK